MKSEFELRTGTDYLHFVHTPCNESATVEYLGLDPAIPVIEIKCVVCKKGWKWKIFQGHGFPPVLKV